MACGHDPPHLVFDERSSDRPGELLHVLHAVGALNVAGAQLVVDVVGLPAAVGAADEDLAAHLVAAVLQDAVEANAAAGGVGWNCGGHDADFRLQHVVEIAL